MDDQLLDGLDSDLFDGLDDIPLDGDVEKAKGTGNALDDKLLDQLKDGEDIGEEQDPLTKIANRMRAAEELIAEQKTTEETQRIQKLIVADLQQMIEIVRKQCKAGGGKKQQPKPSQPKPGKKPQGEKKGGEPNSQASNKPASESQMRDGKAEDTDVKREELEKMLKEVWGHLPARVREQMQNSASEQHLPKYEALIELYYKRLTEPDE